MIMIVSSNNNDNSNNDNSNNDNSSNDNSKDEIKAMIILHIVLYW